MSYFNDSVIWVTGASSGIGEALIRQLDLPTVKLILSARNESKLQDISNSLKHAESLVLPLDLADNDGFDRHVDTVEKRFGRIDLLINNGGISQRANALETTAEVERRIMEVNYFGNVALSKSVVKCMRRTGGGRIAVMSSIAGKFGFFLRSSYSASKHALHGYYESLRLEEEKNNIHVTMICPGKINTSISVHALGGDGSAHGTVDRNQSEGMPVNICAQKILKGIEKEELEVFVGGKEVNAVKLKRLFPRIFYKVIKKTKCHLIRRLLHTILFLPLLGSGQNFNFEFIGVDDGLPLSTVTAVFQDSRDLIWIGTKGGGVATYDGRTITTYDERVGFDNKIVHWITENKDGDILIGSSWGGLSRFKGTRFETIQIPEFKENTGGNLIAHEWKADTLLMSSDAGVLYFMDDSVYQYHIPGLSRKWISVIEYNEKDQEIYMSFGNVIYRIVNHKVLDSIALDGTINDIETFPNEPYVAVVTQEGVHAINWSDHDIISWKNEFVNCVGFGKAGEMWYASQFVWIMNHGDHLLLNKARGFSNSPVLDIMEDRSGDLWMGTDGDGLVHFKRNGFRYYDQIEGFNSGQIFNIFGFEDKLWISDWGNGLFALDQYDQLKHITIDRFDNAGIVTHFVDGEELYIGTTKGIYSVRNNHVKNVNSEFFPSDDIQSVRSIFKSSKNQWWIGTYDDGLRLIENGTYIDLEDAFKDLKFVHSILEDSQGNIWLGTNRGAMKYTENSIEWFGSDVLCNSYVGVILEDDFGRIWFGTDRCVNIYDNGKISKLDYDDGLNSNTIYLLNKDLQGNVYVGTNKGLNKVSFDEDGQIVSIHNLVKEEGFLGTECNSGSTYRDSSGHLYFGTVSGVIGLNPSRILNSKEIPRVYIKDIEVHYKHKVWVGNTHLDWNGIPDKINLSHDENHVSFVMGAVDYSSGNKLKFRFKLEGFDSEWSPESAYNKAVYSNLPSGEYYFLAKAKSAAGNWSEVIKLGPVIIDPAPPPAPPFYKTWWFYTLIGLPVIMVLYYLIIIRNRQLTISKKQLAFEVNLRTKELKKQSDEKEVLLKEIHHRVKNNLQIINSLLNLQSANVSDKQALQAFEECKNRISSMAIIHERMYRTHDMTHILFREYAHDISQNLIASYAVGKKIDLNIRIDDFVLKMDQLVPIGLILNEVITNSLKYAFPDKNEGSIFIETQQDVSSQYIIRIWDNGVGLPKGFDYENSDSLGMQLIILLTEQIEGSLEVESSSKGTKFQIAFCANQDHQ